MGRKYTRKTTRQSWPMATMQAALKAVKLGLKTGVAARVYQIPKKTLMRYIGKQDEVPVVAQLGRFRPILSTDQEAELVHRVVLMAKSGIGMNRKEIRRLAYQIAEKYSVNHPWSNGIAGVEWLRTFLERHPDLVSRKAENTSLARLSGFNRESVRSFFDLLSNIMTTNKYSPGQIWNVDETGFSTVQTRPMQVFAKKGQRQVAAASSAERGTNTTVILAMSASGEYAPPAFIFPRARLTESLKEGAPKNSLFLCNPSGWSTIETCSSWFDHFLQYTKPSTSRPILLILDGHVSHTKNIYMLEKASANNVRILSIPPHTSHKLQPLDVSVMGPVKRKYADVLWEHQKTDPGRAVTVHNIAALVGEALSKAETICNALSGFQATGIYPLNRNIFTDADFSSADFLERTTEPINQPKSNAANIDGAEKRGKLLDNTPIVATTNEINVNENIRSAHKEELSKPSSPLRVNQSKSSAVNTNGMAKSGVIFDETFIATTYENNVAENVRSEHMKGFSKPSSPVQMMGESNSHAPSGNHLETDNEDINIDPNIYYMITESGEIKIEPGLEEIICETPEVQDITDGFVFFTPATTEVEMEDTVPSINLLEGVFSEPLDEKPNDLSPTTMIQPTIIDTKSLLNKRESRRKGQAEELTSVPYRSQLREASASKTIKDITKGARKQPKLSKPEDSLCATCGECFSRSGKGFGWSSCAFCHVWFHCSCNGGDPLLCPSCQ